LQPYIATRTTEWLSFPRIGVLPYTRYGGEAPVGNAAQRRTRAAEMEVERKAATDVYDRAVAFTETTGATTDVRTRRPADAGAGTPREATADVYRRFKQVSDALVAYFDFAILPGPTAVRRAPIADIDAATDADLLSAIPETERRPEAIGIALLETHMQNQPFVARHPSWPRTPRQQYFQILKDYEHVRIPMARRDPVAAPANTRNPARGFLHMPPWLVEALVDAGRLRWGIADFGEGASGDTHHFDLGHHDVEPDGRP
jgi:hypothetical protein